MSSSNNKISVRQLQALLILYFFGTAAIYLPGIAAAHAGNDGWLAVLLAALIAAVSAYLILTAASLFPEMSFHDIACKTLSRPIGKLICTALAAQIALDAALKLRIFGEIVREYLLPQTPFWLVGLVMLALGGFAAYHGFEANGRTAEILVFIVIIPVILLLVLGIPGADFTNLRPAFNADAEGLLRGGFESGYAFSGLTLVLAAAPFLGSQSQEARRRIVSAAAFTGVLFTALTILVIAQKGAESAAAARHPLLAFFFAIEVPGAFMERQNAIIVSLWIFTVFTMVAGAVVLGSVLLRGVINRGARQGYAIFIIAVIYALSLVPQSAAKAMEYSRMLYRHTSVIFVLLLPFVIVVIARIRRLGK